MNELGNLFGILTAVLFGLAILNFCVKFVNRKWVMKLPKESKFRQGYTSVMKFLVKNHRFFGFGAAIGPLCLTIARQSWRKQYAPGPGVLCHFAADNGRRAAVVLQGG